MHKTNISVAQLSACPQILVLDFGSQYTQLIARRLREAGVYTEIVPYFESIENIKAKSARGIILSGGPASVYEEGAYKPDSRVFELGVPVLGICYGMQFIAHHFGGEVVRAEAQEFGKAVLTILDSASLNAPHLLNSSSGMQCEGFAEFPEARTPSALTSENPAKASTATPQNTRTLDSGVVRHCEDSQNPQPLISHCEGDSPKQSIESPKEQNRLPRSDCVSARNDEGDDTQKTGEGQSILEGKSRLCGSEQGDKAGAPIDEASDKLRDLRPKDAPAQKTAPHKDLFAGVKQDSIVWMSHADKVQTLPQGFVELAKSGNTHYCAIADFTRQIYALQFHPEVVHSEQGAQILQNFALRICGASNDWNMKNFAEAEIAKLREIVGADSSIRHCEGDSPKQSIESPKDQNGLPRSDFVSARNDEGNDTQKTREGQSILEEKSRLCGSEQGDKAGAPIDEASDKLRDFHPKDAPGKETTPGKVLCAVSGGVDSSVVAALLYRAIGENLIPVFVDTGLLRLGERKAVEKMFKENLKVPLISVDASELFLNRLKGVRDPEKKRKIIGETFIEVFERETKKHNTHGEIRFLAQGTLYPDVIESVSVKGPSKTIKSHHNVGGLPEWMRFELIEPLRELFKDEVRSLGRELGMPESMLMRHPFPGPGLAIRIMGEVNREDLEVLKRADSVFIDELRKNGLYDSVWQAFCVLLNVRSVGVMGDNRTYDNTICVRAVEALDGMTATFAHLPHDFLERVANRIINEVEGVNRVVYDITSKPPGTIEWE
ncbi:MULTISPECIES: glutamine-hydrolyzing GMP synthase [unclassified Helicobacter]|uniref:glutamine-hydrolyzing GMP synthase n=1 Tax=unclassified Helicobacter TaxID=2593540 RepID=UPI0009F35B19|nr:MULTISPECIES: glutamine-hydrolyzing GMP synthase [unclassified Helicobacter]